MSTAAACIGCGLPCWSQTLMAILTPVAAEPVLCFRLTPVLLFPAFSFCVCGPFWGERGQHSRDSQPCKRKALSYEEYRQRCSNWRKTVSKAHHIKPQSKCCAVMSLHCPNWCTPGSSTGKSMAVNKVVFDPSLWFICCPTPDDSIQTLQPSFRPQYLSSVPVNHTIP